MALLLVFLKRLREFVPPIVLQHVQKLHDVLVSSRAANEKPAPVHSSEVDVTRSSFHDDGFAYRHSSDLLISIIDGRRRFTKPRSIFVTSATAEKHRRGEA